MKNERTPAHELLDYLMQLSGNTHRYVASNFKNINARLKEGYTVEECKEVIEIKVWEWKDNPVMHQHLCPITLFRPTKFPKYLNQVNAAKRNPEKFKKYYEDKRKRESRNTSIQTAFDDIDSMYN